MTPLAIFPDDVDTCIPVIAQVLCRHIDRLGSALWRGGSCPGAQVSPNDRFIAGTVGTVDLARTGHSKLAAFVKAVGALHPTKVVGAEVEFDAEPEKLFEVT